MKRYLMGFIAGNAFLASVVLLLLATGTFNVAATVEPGFPETALAPWVRDASIRRRAPTTPNPLAEQAAVVRVGADHYRTNCLPCHGGPDVSPAEVGQGLNPPPPGLELPGTQGRTDGELFWVVKHGIRMTGMPAFGPTHEDEEIWKIVAYLRHLPDLTEAEQAELRSATEESGHHHGEPESREGGHHDGGHKEQPEPGHDHGGEPSH